MLPLLRSIALSIALSLFWTRFGLTQAAQYPEPERQSTWLWVIDEHTQEGLAGAVIDIGPGQECLTIGNSSKELTWDRHFVTGPAGRVRVPALPPEFSCRITLDGRQLPVLMFGRSSSVTSFHVDPEHVGFDPPVEGDYWRTTDDPTRFIDYIQDARENLIPGVHVRALHSGVSTTSDADGLFRLDIPARYRKGKFPASAAETLVLSKPGYKTLECRDLILNPGVRPVDIVLESGNGRVARRNMSMGGSCKEPVVKRDHAGEIISFEIEPSIYEGWWFFFRAGAKAILKARNMNSAEVFWYPTGTGIENPVSAGSMQKILATPQQDVWVLPLGPDVRSTSFWAQGEDANGHIIRSINLGGVAWDDRP